MKKINNRNFIIRNDDKRHYSNENLEYVNIDEPKEDEDLMITYRYNKKTGKYEFFEVKKTKLENEALHKAKSINEKINPKKTKTETTEKPNTLDDEFEREYQEFVRKLKAEYTAPGAETAPAVDELEIPAELEAVADELPVKHRTRKKN